METYGSQYEELFATLLASSFAVTISVAFAVFGIIVLGFIFRKAGEPFWKAIIPIYNIFIFYKISLGSGWWILLSIVPIVGGLLNIYTMYRLARNFGKSILFTVGLVFFNIIFLAILAFGSSEYKFEK